MEIEREGEREREREREIPQLFLHQLVQASVFATARLTADGRLLKLSDERLTIELATLRKEIANKAWRVASMP